MKLQTWQNWKPDDDEHNGVYIPMRTRWSPWHRVPWEQLNIPEMAYVAMAYGAEDGAELLFRRAFERFLVAMIRTDRAAPDKGRRLLMIERESDGPLHARFWRAHQRIVTMYGFPVHTFEWPTEDGA